MLKKYVLALVCIFGFCAQSRAATESFSDKATVAKFFIEIPGYNLDFEAKGGGSHLLYQPHVSGITGVSVSFLGLFGFGYGFRSPIEESDRIKKGKTTYDDLRFSFGFEELNFDLNYQSYRGFFLENSEMADPSWRSGQAYYQIPDMKLENISANFTYVWSPEHFALASTLDQTVRQTESGGSLLLGASLAHTRFSNADGLIPTQAGSHFGEDQNLTEAGFLALTAKVGYGYSFVARARWYATLAAMAGLGLQLGSLKTPTHSTRRQDFANKIDALFGMGYNGDSLVSGLTVTLDATGYQTEATDISSQIYKVNLFLGGRF